MDRERVAQFARTIRALEQSCTLKPANLFSMNIKVLFIQWAAKVSWEAILTPVTYAVVGFLKRREGVDVYDEVTDFTPFRTDV